MEYIINICMYKILMEYKSHFNKCFWINQTIMTCKSHFNNIIHSDILNNNQK